MKLVIVLVSLLALGSIAAAIFVGTRTFERTVVSDPYGHALRFDEERHARDRLGWRARFDPGSLHPGAASLTFGLLDGAGAPVDGAAIRVALVRPAGPGPELVADARPLGGGRYAAPLGFPAPGFWDVRLDVSRGGDAAGLVQEVRVAAAAEPCDLGGGRCVAPAGPFQVALDLGPRPLLPMKDLVAAVEVLRGGAPVDGAAVEVSFSMKDMFMGENRVALRGAGSGRYAGRAVLVRCASGGRAWVATVSVRAGGLAGSVELPFTVGE